MAKRIMVFFLSVLIIFAGMAFFADEAPITHTHQGNRQTNAENNEESAAKKKQATNKKLPSVSVKDWELMLVNKDNPAPDSSMELVELESGYKIDKRIKTAYDNLLQAALKSDIRLIVLSGYRSLQEQEAILATDTEDYMAQGYSESEAKKKALDYVATPGCSEHQTGLALDVLDDSWYQSGRGLETDYGKSKGGKWLAANCADYGFIIRYPEGKEAQTGIKYEPWHIRYVGVESARYIMANNLSLEEYIDQLKSR